MDFIEEEDYSDSTSIEEVVNLQLCTMEGNWETVKQLYEKDRKYCMININKSRGTALHVAVNDGNVEVVRILVEAIIKHKNEKALELKNEKGDTPLHLAAARGFKDICECIIGKDGKRKHLINIDNYEGETPLFHAALSWQKQTFVYLFSLRSTAKYTYFKDLIRRNGDSILHCAIQREFFDLALIIMNKCPGLSVIQNEDGFSPLKLLATRPSAFRSGIKMIWWKSILYHCIPVGTLNIKKAEELYANKADELGQHSPCPAQENYDTCYLFVTKFQDILAKYLKPFILATTYACGITAPENEEGKQKVSQNHQHFKISIPEDSSCELTSPCELTPPNYAPQDKGGVQKVSQNEQHFKISISEDSSRELVPPNYATCLWFLKFAYIYMKFTYIYILGFSGVGVEDIKKMKQKHKWSGQLLNLFMENPYDSYFGSGAQPKRDVSGTVPYLWPKQENNDRGEITSETEALKKKKTPISETQKRETAILTAARNGIVEMVDELISKIPSAIYETNMENKNVLLVAVEKRRTPVVEALRKRFGDNKNKAVLFDNLIQGVDKDENTVLHLAATRSDKEWLTSGAALQLMWHIKWFQYVQHLVPMDFTIRTNKESKTAWEIFNDSHVELVQNGSEWLKYTSGSWSTVAALLAGVFFATSSNIPGGNRSETGEPTLEGKPAFDAFTLSSVIGLCFSVAALIIFLSIVTSRNEARDFKIDLPRKLFLGLSSLFVSIVAMFISFCSSHFFLIDPKYKNIVFLIYSVTCFPVSLYAIAQFPLYVDLLRGIVTRMPKTSENGKYL